MPRLHVQHERRPAMSRGRHIR